VETVLAKVYSVEPVTVHNPHSHTYIHTRIYIHTHTLTRIHTRIYVHTHILTH